MFTKHTLSDIRGKCGVYMIKNKTTPEKFYIGSSVDLANRFSGHKKDLKKNKHHSPQLQNAWNKYGPDNFEFIVLQHCFSQDQFDVENEYLQKYDPFYNTAKYAESNNVKWCKFTLHVYDLQAEYIGEFSYNDFIALAKCSYDAPAAFLRGELKSVNGYRVFLEKQESLTPIGYGRGKPVYKYDLEGNLLSVYRSCREAAKDSILTRNTLTEDCKRKYLAKGWEHNFTYSHKPPKEYIVKKHKTYEESEEYTKNYVLREAKAGNENHKIRKPVRHIPTGLEFSCATDAAKRFNISPSTVRDHIFGRLKKTKEFEHVL